MENGDKIIVPRHVAQIYKICCRVQHGHDVNQFKECFHQIASIGVNAANHRSQRFFGINARSETTQQFYEQFTKINGKKDAYVLKNDETKNLENRILAYKILENNTSLRLIKESFKNKGLYNGIDKYNTGYQTKISKYLLAYKVIGSRDGSDITNHQFFRKQFARYVANLSHSPDAPRYRGKSNEREIHPEKAMIKLKALFNKQGEELYRLALEEESNDSKYRDAVLAFSTTEIKSNKKWMSRPVIVVAGPSACGKTSATNQVLNQSEKHFGFKKVANGKVNNLFVRVDGGDVREVSQIRKLAIQTANNNGFSGISDLHQKSKVLNKVKSYLFKAAIQVSDVGLIIPDTFSTFFKRLPWMHSISKALLAIPNCKIVFARVVPSVADTSISNAPENEQSVNKNFKNVVSYMGMYRALKNKNFTKSSLSEDVNDLPESKVYDRRGFSYGVSGSLNAEQWFKEKGGDRVTKLFCYNDLILVKELSPNNWVYANSNDAGAYLVSRRVYDMWKTGQNMHGLTLRFYADNLGKLDQKIELQSSAAIKNAIDKIKHRMTEIADQESHEFKQLAAIIESYMVVNISGSLYDLNLLIQNFEQRKDSRGYIPVQLINDLIKSLKSYKDDMEGHLAMAPPEPPSLRRSFS